jgi:hypothetical protein
MPTRPGTPFHDSIYVWIAVGNKTASTLPPPPPPHGVRSEPKKGGGLSSQRELMRLIRAPYLDLIRLLAGPSSAGTYLAPAANADKKKRIAPRLIGRGAFLSGGPISLSHAMRHNANAPGLN